MRNRPRRAKRATAPANVSGSVGAGTGTITSVAASASSVTVLASNAARKGASISNDSTAILYLALSNTTASSSNFTHRLNGGENWDFPTFDGAPYTGIVVGIWASATGSARVTEFV